MSISYLYKLVKRKRISPSIFNNYLENNHININSIKNYKNSWGENLLVYSIKHNTNIEFFEFLYNNGWDLGDNYYKMTPIDICVTYNKNITHQKLLILDWLYDKDVQFNPYYLLAYPRKYINWIRAQVWDLDIDGKNNTGNTALHEVCKKYHARYPPKLDQKLRYNNSYDAFYVLLELGYNPYVKNNYDNTPIDYCIKNSFINNLNILYHFGYKLNEEHLRLLLSVNNYKKLIKNTLWALENHNIVNVNSGKKEFEIELLTNIVNTASVYNENIDNRFILEEMNNKVFFDDFYKIKLFKMDENMFYV